MDATVRPATDADVAPARRLALRAFSATPGQEPDADHPQVDVDRRLVAERDGRIVGHLAAWDLGHHFAGRRVATAGISAVAVAPELRSRGIGGALLRAGLDATRERGEPLATLFPLTRAIYRAHGFELAGAHPRVRLPTSALAALPPVEDVELVPGGPDDVDAMHASERAWAAGQHGMLDRPRTFARRSLEPGEHGAVVLARRDGDLVGHLVYDHVPAGPEGGFYDLDVSELVAADAEVARALWRVLGSSVAAARTVIATVAPEDPLELWLPEHAWQAPPATWRWMVRLLDPAAAVAGRGWPSHLAGVCHLDVTDSLWPDVGGRWTLELADGDATLTRGGTGQVRLDVGALASWFTGWQSATRLVQAGRLDGADPADLAFLDAATAGPTPWVRDFF